MDEQQDPQAQEVQQPVPGQVVQPTQQQPMAQQEQIQYQPQAQVQQPIPVPQPNPIQQQPVQPVAPMQQMPVQAVPPSSPQQSQPVERDGVISWEASEHVNYDNGASWVIAMIGGGVVLIVIIYLLVDLMSAIVVALLLAGLIVYGKRKPKNVQYTISEDGVTVDNRSYSFSDFRSFSLNTNGDLASIFLVPMQRFMIPIVMYVSMESIEQIGEALAQHLPNKQRNPDFMDRLSARLRL